MEQQVVNNPLEVFSAEVWQLILGKIEDSKDLWNVVRADNSFFRELLKSKGDAVIATVFPLLYNYLKGKDLLALRQVSKQLKATVDTYLEDGQRWKNVDEEGNHKLELMLYLNDVRLIEKMRALPQAKIPGGCVYAEGHEEFFEEFGNKVFHLQMAYGYKMRGASGDSVELLKYVRNVLRNTLNVKTLSLRTSGCDGDEDNVVEYLEENPLPELPNLISLSITASMNDAEDDGGVEKAYHGILRKYGPQLEHLSVSQEDDVDFRLRGPMPTLTTIFLRTPHQRTLRSLRMFQAPLQKIDLELNFSSYNIDNVFEILETFGATLKKLCFWSIYSNNAESALIGNSFEFPNRFNLPHLEELRFGCFWPGNDTALDFLLGLKKLRWLALGAFKTCPNVVELSDRAGVIKYLSDEGLQDSFYTSPIWKALPKLDKVIICDCEVEDLEFKVNSMHTRKGYEDYQEEMA